ncbi:MAG: low temperature requirement protein A [Pseudomonadota bacterium]
MPLQDHPLWRGPRHHMDAEDAHDHVHWIELFYDLIHVVTIFMLGNYLSHHLSIDGFLVFAALFTAMWFAWFDSSLFNSLYVSTDITHRVIMTAQICTVMIFAAAIPEVAGDGWTFLALAFAANRAITAFMYWRAIRMGAETTTLASEMARNFFALSVVFALSAFLPQPFGYIVFGAGIVAIQALYLSPGIGVLRFERFVPRHGHMAERFALLLLIVVGEGFFKLVVTLAEKGVTKVTPDVLVNFILGGAAIFVMAWIYFDFAGNAKPKSREIRVRAQWWLSHLVLMLAAVMVGVALAAEVKVGFFEPYPTKYAWLGCIGLAAYLLSLLAIQNVIEERTAHRFATAQVRMIGVALALVTLVIVPHVPSIIGNLSWAAALFSQIIIPVRRAYRAFSEEEKAT